MGVIPDSKITKILSIRQIFSNIFVNKYILYIKADEYFDGEELQVELLKAVAKLLEKQRLVFNMRYFDEMTYEDISEELGTSVVA